MTEAAWNADGMRAGESAPKAELRVERAQAPDATGIKSAGVLPPLRADLRLHEGPSAADGAPTWVIEDPARDRFFQIGRLQGEILSRWRLGTAESVARAINKETLLRVTEDDVTRFARFLASSRSPDRKRRKRSGSSSCTITSSSGFRWSTRTRFSGKRCRPSSGSFSPARFGS